MNFNYTQTCMSSICVDLSGDGESGEFEKVQIVVVGLGNRIKYKLGVDQPMYILMNDFCQKQHIKIAMVKFMSVDGFVVYDYHTPKDLNISRSAIIKSSLYPQKIDG